ncbi:MAG: PD-(D/E)XK nuclease family protein [Aeriscardovia sp.]|nr:PD-(D/E)XK nuclease family protein [Aeriscardovia sp.]
MVGKDEAVERAARLANGTAPDAGTLTAGAAGRVLRVCGAPGTGKSEICFRAFTDPRVRRLVAAGRAFLVVDSRSTADAANSRLFKSFAGQAQRFAFRGGRPARTLASLAFDVVRQQAKRSGEPEPKLLDGDEQSRLLRGIIGTHVRHAEIGDNGDCQTCRLLQEYCAVRVRSDEDGGRTSAQAFRRLLGQEAITQLRDAIARFSELGITDDETTFDSLATRGNVGHRRVVEWRTAAALQRQYALRLAQEYPGQRRLDSSFLLVDAARAVREMAGADGSADTGGVADAPGAAGASVNAEDSARAGLPAMLFVDDCQDLTMAGYSFIRSLVLAGTAVVLVGNDDESVQSFRGSYPAALSLLETRPLEQGGLGADVVELEQPTGLAGHDGYREAVATRVSQAIGSTLGLSEPIPRRPGKMRWDRGGEAGAADKTADRVRAMPASDMPNKPDASLDIRLFRTSQQEMDDLVWQVMSAMVDGDSANGGDGDAKRRQSGYRASDLAVIAHDNTTLRAVGERFKREGIPVRYSSVTRPLKDDATVLGLLAMMRLGAMRETLRDAAVRNDARAEADSGEAVDLLRQVLLSPLCEIRSGSPDETRTGLAGRRRRSIRLPRLNAVNRACRSLMALEAIHRSEADSGIGHVAADAAAMVVPDAADAGSESVDSLLAALLFDGIAGDRRSGGKRSGAAQAAGEPSDEDRKPAALGKKLQAVAGAGRADVDALLAAIEAIRQGQDAVDKGTDASVHARLWAMWSSCRALFSEQPATVKPSDDPLSLADAWRWEALGADASGQEANERLDAVIRLFHHARAAGGQSVDEFARSLMEAQFEADSLSKTAPKTDAVVLATPAGALSLHPRKAWIVSVQDGVWPNLTPRGTIFGSQELADLVVRQRLGVTGGVTLHERDLDTLYSEMRGFYVALTRATETTTLSAVWSDDTQPSRFFAEFLQGNGIIRSTEARSAFSGVGSLTDADAAARRSAIAGRTATIPGIVAVARARLAEAMATGDDATADDAATALAVLAAANVPHADPREWDFVDGHGAGRSVGAQTAPGNNDAAGQTPASAAQKVVKLSPSNVDNIWKCPLKWALERRFSGPTASSAQMSFGTLIHGCAQYATEQGWDLRPDLFGATPDEQRQTMTDALMDHFRQQRAQQPASASLDDRWNLADQEDRARSALSSIARYFVDGFRPTGAIGASSDAGAASGTLSGSGLPRSLGQLDASAAEVSIETARFTIADISRFVKSDCRFASPAERSTTGAELFAVLDALAGGFAAGQIDENSRIQLSGRLDRLERRTDEEGGHPRLNIVDWKTGGSYVGKSFSDLQLVCYQLELAFGQVLDADGNADQRWRDTKTTPVDRAMLFSVEKEEYPATEGTTAAAPAESLYQPGLFADGKHGRELVRKLDASDGRVLLKPSRSSKEQSFQMLFPEEKTLTMPEQPSSALANETRDVLAAEQANAAKSSAQFDPSLETDLLPWALAMLSRVAYAASYKNSPTLIAKRKDDGVCRYCDFKRVCPAWREESRTVYGPVMAQCTDADDLAAAMESLDDGASGVDAVADGTIKEKDGNHE